MKTLFASLILVFSFNASAGLGWFLVGAALSEEAQKKEQKKLTKSELEFLINNIERDMPLLCNKNTSIYFSRCWNDFTSPEKIVYVPSNRAEAIGTYFLNKGYKLRVADDKLIFDFIKEHEKYLEHKRVPISVETGIFVSFVLFIVGFFTYFKYKQKKYAKYIKELYYQDPSFIFYETEDRELLNKMLEKDDLPSWNFVVKDGKLVRITAENGYSFRIVAEHKSFLKDIFKRHF